MSIKTIYFCVYQTLSWYLRLMSMVASETSCERLISTMRYVLPQRASRSSGDLVDAKIIMINTKFSVDHGVLKAKSKI